MKRVTQAAANRETMSFDREALFVSNPRVIGDDVGLDSLQIPNRGNKLKRKGHPTSEALVAGRRPFKKVCERRRQAFAFLASVVLIQRY